MPETAPAAAGKECKFSPKPRKNDLVTLTLLRHPHHSNMRANWINLTPLACIYSNTLLIF